MIKKVTIPAKHYVGLVKRESMDMPLSFLTPWGTDAAFEKRKETVDRWAGSGYRETKLDSAVIDNTPMSGFKLVDDIRGGGRSSQDYWKIKDPRGFYAEISSRNFADIMTECMMDRGEIIDQCVWAREGSNNVLLNVSSESYKEAVAFTQVNTTSAEWTAAQLGDTVTLQNGTTGIYYGRLRGVSVENYASIRTKSEGETIDYGKNLFHVILVENFQPHWGAVKPQCLYLIRTAKLSSVTANSAGLDKKQCEVILNQLVQSGISVIEHGYSFTRYVALYFDKITSEKLSMVPTDLQTYQDAVTAKKSDSSDPNMFSRFFFRINPNEAISSKPSIVRYHSIKGNNLFENSLPVFLINPLSVNIVPKTRVRATRYYKDVSELEVAEEDLNVHTYDSIFFLDGQITTTAGNIFKFRI